MILDDHVGEFQLGTNKVFLRENLERTLEHERATILRKAAVVVQRNVRGFLARKHYTNARRSAVKLQAAMRSVTDLEKSLFTLRCTSCNNYFTSGIK